VHHTRAAVIRSSRLFDSIVWVGVDVMFEWCLLESESCVFKAYSPAVRQYTACSSSMASQDGLPVSSGPLLPARCQAVYVHTPDVQHSFQLGGPAVMSLRRCPVKCTIWRELLLCTAVTSSVQRSCHAFEPFRSSLEAMSRVLRSLPCRFTGSVYLSLYKQPTLIMNHGQHAYTCIVGLQDQPARPPLVD
jgi:hypothetical protein